MAKFICDNCSVQNLVRGARKSLLTDFSLRMGPLLVHLTLEKWATSRLTIISSKKTMLITKMKLSLSMETELS